MRRVAAEVLGVMLVLASMAGAWLAVVGLYVRSSPRPEARAAVVVSAAEATTPAPIAKPKPPPTPPEPPPAPVPPEDPTPKVVGPLLSSAEKAKTEADKLGRESDDLIRKEAEARKTATLWRDRADAVRDDLARLDDGLGKVEEDLDALARFRDVLAKRRDEAKLEVARARSADGLAVLPYKGPNGTWRRPIPIECRDGQATIQPGGPSFNLLELSLGVRLQPSALAMAVRTYMAHAERMPSPDGAPVVPYVLFLVRPDGIRPYYEARATLEPMGIAFGYELLGQDEQVEFPDLDDPIDWSEVKSWKFARGLESLPGGLAGTTPGSGMGMGGLLPEGGEKLGDPASQPWPVQPPEWARSGPGFGLENGMGEDPMGGMALFGSGGLAASTPMGLPRFEPVPGGLASGGPPSTDTPPTTAPSPLPATSSTPTPPGGGVGSGVLGALPGRDESGWPGQTGRPPRLAGDPTGAGSSRSGRPSATASSAIRRGMPGGGLIPGSVGDRMMNGGRGAAASQPFDPGEYDSTRKGERLEGGDSIADNTSGGTGTDTGTSATGTTGAGTGVGGTAASGSTVPGAAGASSSSSGSGSTGSESGLVGLGGASTGGGTATGSSDSGGSGGDEPGGGTGAGASGGMVRFRPRRTVDLTLACGRDDIVVQPGGYRLKAGDPRLVDTLREIVRRRELTHPEAEVRPRLTYLVEPGGEATYWAARRSTVLVGLGWPAQLRISEGSPLRLAVGGETR